MAGKKDDCKTAARCPQLLYRSPDESGYLGLGVRSAQSAMESRPRAVSKLSGYRPGTRVTKCRQISIFESGRFRFELRLAGIVADDAHFRFWKPFAGFGLDREGWFRGSSSQLLGYLKRLEIRVGTNYRFHNWLFYPSRARHRVSRHSLHLLPKQNREIRIQPNAHTDNSSVASQKCADRKALPRLGSRVRIPSPAPSLANSSS